MTSDFGLRALGIALALLTGAIHIALSLVDLIPGEPTTGPVFAAMGLGFLGCAVILALGRGKVYPVVPVYALLLIVAYVATRSTGPVEAIGLTAKAAEIGLAVTSALLIRGAARRPA